MSAPDLDSSLSNSKELNHKMQQDIDRREFMEKKLDKIIETANKFTFSKKLIEQLTEEAIKKPKEEFKDHCLL